VSRVAEVIMVLAVLTSLLILAPCGGALMGRAQVCRAAWFGADCAEGYQALDALRPAGRTPRPGTARPFKMLKLLITLEALILKNRHKTPNGRHTPPVEMLAEIAARNNRLLFWNDAV